MTSANNAQKIGDPEKAPVSATTSVAHLEQRQEQAKSNNMKKIQHFGFSLLLLALLAITIAAASKTSPRHAPAMSAEERIKLQELLNTIEPASLHEILHKHLKDKYQHGVYQEDKAAMEVVAQSNKEVAHSLIELAKRQAPNTTTTVIEAVTLTTDITISPSVPVTTTDGGTTAVAPPTTVVAPPTTSAANVPTTPATSPPPNQVPTTSQQDTQGTTAETNPTSAAQNPPSTTANGGAGTKSAAGGGTATETSLSTAVVTKTQNPPTTSGSSTNDKSSSKGSSPTSDSSVTQETVFTTTRPDGSVATVTSVTVVPAGQAEHTGTSGATKTNGSPSLQSNGATPMVVGLNGVMGMLGLVVVGVL